MVTFSFRNMVRKHTVMTIHNNSIEQTTMNTAKLSPEIQKRFSIIIPAYNEAGNISNTISQLTRYFPQSEIIVVNDGSVDGTGEKVQISDKVKLLNHFSNQGYGASLKTGMRASKNEYVAWFDADNEHRVTDLERIMSRIHEEKLAAVIGERQNTNFSLVRSLGKYIIKSISRSLNIKKYKDLNCGLRAFRRSIISQYLPFLPDGFSASMTSLVIMVERGHPMVFEPIKVNKRVGKSKVKIADGFKTILLLLRIIMLFAPLRIFFKLGIFLILIGIIYSVLVAILQGLGVPVFGSVLVLMGMLIAIMGLIADQISQFRLQLLTNSNNSNENRN